MKLPSFQLYPGDWRKDAGVQALDFFARGVWFEIMLLMHESEERGVLLLNGKRMPDEALANALGLTLDLLKQNVSKILDYGVASVNPDNGALMCRRMVRDEKLRKIRAESGKQGGNPVLLKQKSTTHLKQKPTPSSSSSSSSSDVPPIVPQEGNGNGGFGMDEHGRKVDWEHVEKWLNAAISNGADYTRAETRTAFFAFEANGWMFGKNPVTDWRAALERQIQTDRTQSPASRPPSLLTQLKAIQVQIQTHPGRPEAPIGRKPTDAERSEYRELIAREKSLNALIANGGQNA